MGRGGNIGGCPTCGRTDHIMQSQGVCERCWRWERWHTDPEYRARQLEAPLSAVVWASPQMANTSPCMTVRSHQSAAGGGNQCRTMSVDRTCHGCLIPRP